MADTEGTQALAERLDRKAIEHALMRLEKEPRCLECQVAIPRLRAMVEGSELARDAGSPSDAAEGVDALSKAADRFRAAIDRFREDGGDTHDVAVTATAVIAAKYAVSSVFPRYTGHGGWTLDPDFLARVSDEAAQRIGVGEDEPSPSWETVESVLLAAPVVAALRAAQPGEPEALTYLLDVTRALIDESAALARLGDVGRDAERDRDRDIIARAIQRYDKRDNDPWAADFARADFILAALRAGAPQQKGQGT